MIRVWRGCSFRGEALLSKVPRPKSYLGRYDAVICRPLSLNAYNSCLTTAANGTSIKRSSEVNVTRRTAKALNKLAIQL